MLNILELEMVFKKHCENHQIVSFLELHTSNFSVRFLFFGWDPYLKNKIRKKYTYTYM